MTLLRTTLLSRNFVVPPAAYQGAGSWNAQFGTQGVRDIRIRRASITLPQLFNQPVGSGRDPVYGTPSFNGSAVIVDAEGVEEDTIIVSAGAPWTFGRPATPVGQLKGTWRVFQVKNSVPYTWALLWDMRKDVDLIVPGGAPTINLLFTFPYMASQTILDGTFVAQAYLTFEYEANVRP